MPPVTPHVTSPTSVRCDHVLFCSLFNRSIYLPTSLATVSGAITSSSVRYFQPNPSSNGNRSIVSGAITSSSVRYFVLDHPLADKLISVSGAITSSSVRYFAGGPLYGVKGVSVRCDHVLFCSLFPWKRLGVFLSYPVSGAITSSSVRYLDYLRRAPGPHVGVRCDHVLFCSLFTMGWSGSVNRLGSVRCDHVLFCSLFRMRSAKKWLGPMCPVRSRPLLFVIRLSLPQTPMVDGVSGAITSSSVRY